MRRLRVALAVVAVMAAVTIGGGPAGADVDACAGTGLANVSPPHPSIASGGPATTSTLTVYLSFAACAVDFQVWLYVEITGWCEETTGWGVTSDGHSFIVVGSTYSFALSGQVTGTVVLTSHRGPCEPVISNTFYATGAVAYAH